MGIQWPLVLFTALTGMGGMVAFAAGADVLARKRVDNLGKSCILSLVLLVVGGICSALHLAHPLRAVGVLTHPGAGIFLEAVLLGLLAVFLVVALMLGKNGEVGPRVKAVAAIAMALGVCLAFFSGASYVMAAHPAWNTLLLPASYLAASAVAGWMAYLVICVAGKDGESCGKFGWAGLAIAICAIIVLAAYGIVSGAFEANAAVGITVMLLSGVVPAVCFVLLAKRASMGAAAVGTACAVAGSVLLRVLMWMTFGAGLAAASIAVAL